MDSLEVSAGYAPPLAQERSLLDRLATFTSPRNLDTTYLTHGVHPYPAKYIPQLPREVITEHTNERHTVFDPFCGSGTTLLEACVLGRKSVGVDSNPIAALIARAKTTALSDSELAQALTTLAIVRQFAAHADVPDCPIPEFPRRAHWFQQNMLRELAWLRALVSAEQQAPIRSLLECVLSSIIVLCSNQESDTRYAAVSKSLPDGHALRLFARRLQRTVDAVAQLSRIAQARRNRPVVIHADLRAITCDMVPDHTADLIVTSPPYPNSYDYYLYHKLRMYWLGFDVESARLSEIGSRQEHSSRRAPITSFEEKMAPCLRQVARVLKPSKLAYFFVGDAVIAGRLVDMAEVFERVCKAAGLGFVARTHYSLADVTRSFREKQSSSNRNVFAKKQHVLVFEGRAPRCPVLTIPRTTASPKPTWRLRPLNGAILNGDRIAIQEDRGDRHIHSLGRYPSKFIPDIPRWALAEFSSRGDLVLDPFVGCGTTVVEAALAARRCVGVDISPYACLLTRAKTTSASEPLLRRHAKLLMGAINQPALFTCAPRMMFDYDDFWFPLAHLEEFAGIRSFIEREIPRRTRDFFLALLSTVIRRSSFQDESQIKVKRDPRKVLSGTPGPAQLLVTRIPIEVGRLIRFNSLLPSAPAVGTIQAKAEDLDRQGIPPRSVDLVVTSPPYINAMNYPMTHRYENLLLGLVPPQGAIEHQRDYAGTERVYSRDYAELRLFDRSSPLARDVNAVLEGIYRREPKRSFIVFDYLERMAKAIRSISGLCRPGAIFVLVAGDNMIRDVRVPTFSSLVTLAQAEGFQLQKQFTYEIVRNALKIHRHETGRKIDTDGVAVLEFRP